jgi:hypothetical protein
VNTHGSNDEIDIELGPEDQLGMFFFHFLSLSNINFTVEELKKHWRSPIYSFFNPDVTFQYHENRPCHFFTCAAPRCKVSAGGVRRFQDSKDKASTANLKHHAIRCFGADAVNDAIAGKKTAPNTSIFTLFARQGKQPPVKYSHRVHTNPEVRSVIFILSYSFSDTYL